MVQFHPFQGLDNFVRTTLPVSFRSDTKSRCSFQSGMYANVSIISYTGKVEMEQTYGGLSKYKEGKPCYRNPRSGCFQLNVTSQCHKTNAASPSCT